MRVLIVTPRYAPHVGGLETHVRETAKRLAAAVDISILTTNPTTGYVPHTQVDGITVREVRAYPETRDWLLAPGVWGACATADVDLIHFQSVATAVPPLGMLAALRGGRPYMLTFHSGGAVSSLRQRLRSTQWQALRPLLKKARALVAVSETEKAFFCDVLGLPTSRIEVIQNGSEIPRPDGASAYIRPGDAPVVVSVGRLEKYKGHHRLIEAMPHLRALAPRARLVIVGGGPYRDTLLRRSADLGVADAVDIIAFDGTQRQELANLLGGADVAALLSDYEAHPVAVMEALYIGVPVLTARTSGFLDLAEAGLVTAIDPAASPDEVAGALLRLAGTVRAPTELRSWDDCAKDLLRVYQDVVGALPRGDGQ